MRRVFVILGIIAASLTAILAVLPVSNLAILPAVGALAFGAIAYYISKKEGQIKKIIPFIFYLTLSALCISGYKAIFSKSEISNTKTLEATETKSETEAIQELESLDIDVNELESIDLEQ